MPVAWSAPGHPGALIPSTLSWPGETQLEIRLDFETPGDAITWTVGRDLLASALDCGSAGEEDVRLRVRNGQLHLYLQGMDQCAELSAAADPLRAFLESTVCLVPLGEEDLGIEDALERMLDEA